MIDGQLDIFAAIDEANAEQRPRCAFNSPARGVTARLAEFAEWQAEYGRNGSLRRSHAWTAMFPGKVGPTDRCMPAVLDADVRKPDELDDIATWPRCGCSENYDELMYRGVCRGCDWEGRPRRGENPAVEDACDHAWPGWRDVPIVAKWPGSSSPKAGRWLERALASYPAGWLEAGGPIRTLRPSGGTRHNGQHATPYGGYDMAVLDPKETQ
jgi:hypothetical protein